MAIAPVLLLGGQRKTRSISHSGCPPKILQSRHDPEDFLFAKLLLSLPFLLPLPEGRSRCWLVSKMVRLIGTGLIAVGVMVVLINPMLVQIWVAAIALGVLSHWVTQN